jgi:hypothetical protein
MMVDRRILARIDCDPTLAFTPPQLAKLQQWLANRYSRATFADEFNRRINGAFKSQSVKNALNTLAPYVNIRVTVSPATDELEQTKNYFARFVILTNATDFNSQQNLVTAFDTFRDALKATSGINCSVELQQENQWTVADYRTTVHYPFDEFSYSKSNGRTIGLLPPPK